MPTTWLLAPAVPAEAPSPGAGNDAQAMKAKLQRAKRTLDNMRKRESDAIAAKGAAEARLAELEPLQAQASIKCYSDPCCTVYYSKSYMV